MEHTFYLYASVNQCSSSDVLRYSIQREHILFLQFSFLLALLIRFFLANVCSQLLYGIQIFTMLNNVESPRL